MYLGKMVGGYNVLTLVDLLDSPDLAVDAAAQLKVYTRACLLAPPTEKPAPWARLSKTKPTHPPSAIDPPPPGGVGPTLSKGLVHNPLP